MSQVTFQEFREKISILELALAIGYKFNKEKTCRKYPVLDHAAREERIYIINPTFSGNQGYANVNDDCDKGTLVDFVKKRLHSDFKSFFEPGKSVFHSINKVLYHYLGQEMPKQDYSEIIGKHNDMRSGQPAGEEQFRLGLFNLLPLDHRQFLHRRGLSNATLDDQRFAGRIYNVKGQGENKEFYNIAFPYYKALEGPVCGLEIKNYNFGGHAPTSEKSSSVWVSRAVGPVGKVYIMESGMDALSHYELYRPPDALYISTGGNLTTGQVDTIERISRGLPGPRPKTHLCFDNDTDGAYFGLKYVVEARFPEIPAGTTITKTKDYIHLFIPAAGSDSIKEKLIQFLKESNEGNNHYLPAAGSDDFLRNEISKLFYQVDAAGEGMEVKIPKTFSHINTFTKALIEAAGLGQQITIEGARLKDFNEDLQKQKGIEVKSFSSHHTKIKKEEKGKESDDQHNVNHQVQLKPPQLQNENGLDTAADVGQAPGEKRGFKR